MSGKSRVRDTCGVQPLVSVVVPVFNGMPHLPALVDSLFALDYPNLEFVFSEGGGSDASSEHLRNLDDPRIRLLSMPRGTSAAENWTAATVAASGEFIKLVCQDDLLTPASISQQVSDLESHPSAVMAIAQRDIIDARGNLLFARRGLSGVPRNRTLISGNDMIRTCYEQGTNVLGEPLAVLFRSIPLKESMPWDDSNPLMLDLSTYEKVATRGEVVVRHGSVGAFRVSSKSWSTRIAKQQLEQTRQWQENYRKTCGGQLPWPSHVRARLGRHVHTQLRRLAYATLRLKGNL